ncbi:MAG TPA: hypothetical protein P5239_01400 [Victivallales bacterium]|nr:hypothetical protein [Victivallales bacterium]
MAGVCILYLAGVVQNQEVHVSLNTILRIILLYDAVRVVATS